MFSRATQLIALTLFVLGGFVRADDLKLVGSIIPTEAASTKSDVIFIGKITRFGKEGSCGPGECTLLGNTVEVTRVLKGAFEHHPLVSIYYFTDSHEQMTESSHPYIFFASKNPQKDPDPFTVFKLLPVTDSNIAAVTKH